MVWHPPFPSTSLFLSMPLSPAYAQSIMRILQGNAPSSKEAMLRQTPIRIPSDSAEWQINSGANTDGTFTYARAKTDDLKAMVAFFQLTPGTGLLDGGLVLTMKTVTELKKTGDRAGYVPCWFLPWKSGRIVRLKIASVVGNGKTLQFGNGIDPMPNPDIFFTASLNGCSVFAVGDAMAPSVYHAGTDGKMTDVQGNETTEKAWERLVGKSGGGKQVGSIGATDYISELIPGARSNDDRLTTNDAGVFYKTTARAKQLEQRLKDRGDLSKFSVSPVGSVFGIRDGTNWRMTLVRNALVMTQKVTSTQKSSAAQFLSRISGKGKIPPAVVTHTSNQIVNLGYKTFFPGTGTSSYRDLGNVIIA